MVLILCNAYNFGSRKIFLSFVTKKSYIEISYRIGLTFSNLGIITICPAWIALSKGLLLGSNRRGNS